ncbi:uncharacterized protein BJX67DRAFT_339053 [Aspergillus lucknowensis]|uniref:Uncharacterized protein n=1 Tax=Aspergillus lucknowensis TaxID=176173 RepID=A0ABR4M6Q8_9EURO
MPAVEKLSIKSESYPVNMPSPGGLASSRYATTETPSINSQPQHIDPQAWEQPSDSLKLAQRSLKRQILQTRIELCDAEDARDQESTDAEKRQALRNYQRIDHKLQLLELDLEEEA